MTLEYLARIGVQCGNKLLHLCDQQFLVTLRGSQPKSAHQPTIHIHPQLALHTVRVGE